MTLIRCAWCGELKATHEQPFCNDCIADFPEPYEDISYHPDYEGKICSVCGDVLTGTQELACGTCLSCMWWI